MSPIKIINKYSVARICEVYLWCGTEKEKNVRGKNTIFHNGQELLKNTENRQNVKFIS